MKGHIYENAYDFLKNTEGLLMPDEAKHGLLYSISKKLVKNQDHYGSEKPWFFTISESNQILSAFIRTPPHNLIEAYFSGDIKMISETLCDTLENHYGKIPGIIGEAVFVKYLSDHYCKRNNVKIKSIMNQRIYKLEKVNIIKYPDGKFRQAEEKDRKILSEWCRSFVQEALGKERTNKDIDLSSFFVWETDKIVTMAKMVRPLLNGISISEVYTPPDYRKKGYASACVHALCNYLLKSGYKYCMLYTDLANPISNSIYQNIGFNPVCDSIQIDFESFPVQ